MKRERGVSLITIIIIIALLFIASLTTIPFLFKTKEARLKEETKKELNALYEAIIGDGKLHFGYHGDLGVIPPQLKDLIVKGSQLDYSTGIGPGGSEQYVGWKGPYYHPKRWDGTNILDPYGNPYVNDIDTVSNSWQIRSMGPNGQDDGGAGDDITVRAPISIETYGGYAYIPSAIKFSFNVGHFTGAQDSDRPAYFRIYLPLYDSTIYRDFISNDGIVSHVPMGQRFVLPALYEKNYTASGEVCAFFYSSEYGTNGGKIISFPFPGEGIFAVNWPSYMDTLTDMGSYCRRIWFSNVVYIMVKSSLTWRYPDCGALQNGVLLKVTGEDQSFQDLTFDAGSGYFSTTIIYYFWFPPPYYYIVTSNSGATINITINNCF